MNTALISDNKRQAFSWLLDGMGLVCAAAYTVLAWYSIHPEHLSLPIFYALLTIAFIATLIAFKGADDKTLSPLKLMLWAVCFRLIGIWGEPLWEDDFFRYLWGGYRFFETGSPYGIVHPVFLVIVQFLLTFINYWHSSIIQKSRQYMDLLYSTHFY